MLTTKNSHFDDFPLLTYSEAVYLYFKRNIMVAIVFTQQRLLSLGLVSITQNRITNYETIN